MWNGHEGGWKNCYTLAREHFWISDEMTNGFSRTVSDVEHGAELMSDTHPLLCLVDYGNPLYL